MEAAKKEFVDLAGGKNPIYISARQFALSGLSDLIRVLMETVDDALFELSDKVGNDHDRNMYFDAMREIRLKRDGLQLHFDYEMKQCFDRFVNGSYPSQDLDDYRDENELTLMELDDLEGSIAIDNMISKARPNFEDDLFALTERLKLVLCRKQIDEAVNPFDPKAICDSFHKASDLLDTGIQVKLILYKLFDKFVVNSLGNFYKELNKLFEKKGILPRFKAEQERTKRASRFIAKNIQNNGAKLHAAPNPEETGHKKPVTPGATPTDLNDLFATLQQAVTGKGAPNRLEGNTGLDEGDRSNGGFIVALTNLQATGIPSQQTTSMDPLNIKAAIDRQLVDFTQQNRHRLNATDRWTMDIVSMLFDLFFDDPVMPEPIKVLIGRLQILILKVAFLDKEFFNQRKHPARKLLDSISRASLGWGNSHKDEKELIEKVEEVVNSLVDKFEEDISVFEESYISIEDFLHKQEHDTQAAEEKLRQQERQKDHRVLQAKDAAAALIGKLTKDQELSAEVINFLETTWTSVLINAYLSLGETSSHWSDLKRITTTFVWSLIPKYNEEERTKIIKTIPALLRAMSRGMGLVEISTDGQNRIFEILAKEHAKTVRQTAKKTVSPSDDWTACREDSNTETTDTEFFHNAIAGIEVEDIEIDDESIILVSFTPTSEVIENLDQFAASVELGKITFDEEIILGPDENKNFGLMEGDNEYLGQALSMEIGSWVAFIESESKTQIARLSWKSDVTNSFLFVNRKGNKIRNMTISGFVGELRAGRVKCIKSSSVFDRAISKIKPKLLH